MYKKSFTNFKKWSSLIAFLIGLFISAQDINVLYFDSGNSMGTASNTDIGLDVSVLDSRFATVRVNGTVRTADMTNDVGNNISTLPTTPSSYTNIQLVVVQGWYHNSTVSPNTIRFISKNQADALITYVKNGGVLVSSMEGITVQTVNQDFNKYIGEALLTQGASITVSAAGSSMTNPAPAYHNGSGPLNLLTSASTVTNTASASSFTGIPSESIIYSFTKPSSTATCNSTALEFIAPSYPGDLNAQARGVNGFAYLGGDVSGPLSRNFAGSTNRDNSQANINLTSLIYDFLNTPSAMTTRRAWSGTASNVNSFCPVTGLASTCASAPVPPSLTGNTLSNTCPADTANLNSLYTGTPPAGTILVWFTNTTHNGAAYATPTTASAGTYYAYYYDSTAGCYSPASGSVTVTITNIPTFNTNLTASTQTACQNGSTAPLTVAGTSVTYQWYSNTTNSSVGGTAISGATSASYTPSTATIGTLYYYAVITNAAGCTATSNIKPVQVNALITAQPNSAAQNLCVNGTATALTVTATGATGYQWYYSDAATGGTVTTVSGATGASYTPATTVAFATRYYYVTVTGSCGTASSSPRTPITVSAYPTAVSVTPATQSVPSNNTPTPLTGSATGATSYQWYSNTVNSNTGGTLIPGATATTYTPPTNVVGTQYYYLVAVNGGSCGTSSSAVQITVTACPAGTTAPTVNTAVSNNCPTTTVNLNTQAHIGTIPANTTLQWFTDAAHTAAVPTPNAVGAGTYYAFYYSSSSNCYSPASNPVTVTITTCVCAAPADPQAVNLASITVPAAPSGSVIQWHNSATPSSSTLLTNTTVQATSTPTNYWVYYYDTTNNCYSPGSKVVTVTNACCNYPTVNLTSLSQNTPPSGTAVVWYTTSSRNTGTQVANPAAVGNGTYWPFFYDAVNLCYSVAGTPVLVAVDNNCSTACYKPGLTTGTVLDTKVGISSLGRAGASDADNWPMTRKGGWIALESKTKAFVPNRVEFNASGNPIGIPTTDFVEGMMVYDSTNNCMKIYTLKQGDTAMAWHCMTTQTCPD